MIKSPSPSVYFKTNAFSTVSGILDPLLRTGACKSYSFKTVSYRSVTAIFACTSITRISPRKSHFTKILSGFFWLFSRDITLARVSSSAASRRDTNSSDCLSILRPIFVFRIFLKLLNKCGAGKTKLDVPRLNPPETATSNPC